MDLIDEFRMFGFPPERLQELKQQGKQYGHKTKNNPENLSDSLDRILGVCPAVAGTGTFQILPA